MFFFAKGRSKANAELVHIDRYYICKVPFTLISPLHMISVHVILNESSPGNATPKSKKPDKIKLEISQIPHKPQSLVCHHFLPYK